MKWVKAFFTGIGLVFLAFWLYVWAYLAWIAFRPVPPVPHYGVRYSVADAGPVGDTLMFDPYTRDTLSYGWRLTDDGRVVHLSQAGQATAERSRKAAAANLARRLGLAYEDDDNPVRAVASNGDALIRTDEFVRLWRDGKFAATIPHGIRGYSWKPWVLGFLVLNPQDKAIGNSKIATSYASSGGLVDPHGRWMALVWNGDGRQPEDLNGWIATSSGWYLDHGIDINGRGQILCLGRRTDARGAEDYRREDLHWVILTPR